MAETKFESDLTIKEIERNFQNTDFFAGIMEGLQEALAVEKCDAASKTYVRKKFPFD